MPFDRENALFVEFGRTGGLALPPVARESNSKNKLVQQGLDVSSKGKKHERVILDWFVLESGVFGQLGVHVHRNAEKAFKKGVGNVKVLVIVMVRLIISGDVICKHVQARSPTGQLGVIALKHVVMVNEQDRGIVLQLLQYPAQNN